MFEVLRHPGSGTNEAGGGGDLGNLARPMNARPIITIDGQSSAGKSTLAKNLAESYDLPLIDTGAYYRTLGLHATRQQLPVEVFDADSAVKLSDKQLLGLAEKYAPHALSSSESGEQRDLLEAVRAGVTQKLLTIVTEMDLSFGSRLELGTVWNKGEKLHAPQDSNFSSLLHTREISEAARLVARVQKARDLINDKIRLKAARGGVFVGRDCGTKILPDEATVKFSLIADPEIRTLRRICEYDGVNPGEVDRKSERFQRELAAINKRDESDRANTQKAEDAIEIDTTPRGEHPLGDPHDILREAKEYTDEAMRPFKEPKDG